MSDRPAPRKVTRIQREKRQTILDAALQVFSVHGLRGATLDKIAAEAGMSKPHVLYYFGGKDAIYTELLEGLLEVWLDPLREMSENGDTLASLILEPSTSSVIILMSFPPRRMGYAHLPLPADVRNWGGSGSTRCLACGH